MKTHHRIAIVLGVVAFAVVLFMATPTNDDAEVAEHVREVLRVEMDAAADNVIVTVDEETVTIEGDVEDEQEVVRIREGIEPIIGDRELILEFEPSD